MTARMTPKALRDIAWTLDQLARLMSTAVESAAALIPTNADEVDVTLTFTSTGDGWWTDEDKARQLLHWVSGTEQQDDLRRWADDLEASGGGA